MMFCIHKKLKICSVSNCIDDHCIYIHERLEQYRKNNEVIEVKACNWELKNDK